MLRRVPGLKLTYSHIVRSIVSLVFKSDVDFDFIPFHIHYLVSTMRLVYVCVSTEPHHTIISSAIFEKPHLSHTYILRHFFDEKFPYITPDAPFGFAHQDRVLSPSTMFKKSLGECHLQRPRNETGLSAEISILAPSRNQ